MSECIISNVQIVTADDVINGSLQIIDGEIADVSESPSNLSSAIDFEGDYLIPGLVELHTDNIERHVMPRPKSFWPVKSAVLNHDREIISAGITTVFDAICVGHMDAAARSDDVIEEIAATISELHSSGSLKASHLIHWRCEVAGASLSEKIGGLAQNDRTGLFSVMDHTPGQRQFVSLDAYFTYYQGKYGLNDQQMQEYMDERLEAQAKYSAPNRLEIVELAHSMNVPLASHDDATVEHVKEAVDNEIVIAEFPTTLEAAKASHDSGLAVLMGAPNVVRGKSHSGNVSALDLAGADVLDILSSDYVPFSLLYGATLLEKRIEQISLPQAIASVTKNPAEKAGLNDRGEIKQGKRADIVRYRMQEDVPHVVEVWHTGKRVA